MWRTPRAIMVAIVAVSLAGCGTICNFVGGIRDPEREPRVYGGVLRDFKIIDEQTNAIANQSACYGKGAVWALALAVVDPALSFAGDTLTLPITVFIQERRAAAYRDECSRAGSTKAPA